MSLRHHTMETVGESKGLDKKERNKNVSYYQWRRQELSLSSPRCEEQCTWEDEQDERCIFPTFLLCTCPSREIYLNSE